MTQKRKLKFKRFKFKKQGKGLWKQILVSLVAAMIVVALVGSAVSLIYLKTVIDASPTLNVDDFTSPNSSRIYDSEGVLIADIGSQLRENVGYDKLPQVLVDAFVSIEDSRFFVHNGFDLPRFTKAALENLIATMKSGKVNFGQGGSTFTMQLVKNTYFVTESSLAPKKIQRKIQEIYLAMQLDSQISKKRVLELYLNMINFGVPGNSRGVQKAAEYYFGKSVTDLNISESAMLAGVINAPTTFNPMKNLFEATKRRNTVLDMMLRHGYITQLEFDLAKSIKVEDLLVGTKVSTAANTTDAIPYQAYVDAVVEEVKTLTGQDPVSTPMIIYTSMNRKVQDTVEAIENGSTTVKWPNELMQTAIVSMNNQTGEIIALGGGRYYNAERLLNRATSMYKQPGSAVKPFLSYALAFDYLGYATTQTLEDKPITYGGTDIVIQDYDGAYRGNVTLETAMGMSLNIPAILTLQNVINTLGASKVADYLISIGFDKVKRNAFNVGYAIGGSTYLATPLQMAGAHSTLLNEGVYIQPHTVTRIEFTNGSDPLVPTYAGTQVLSPDASYLSSYLMERNVTGPFANYMQILKRAYPVYAKTGTTDWGKDGLPYNIPENAAKDKWMIASTSQYTTTVWVGYDKAIKDKTTYFTANDSRLNLPGNINSLILNTINTITGAQPTAIAKPAGVVGITHVLGVFPYVSPIANMAPSMVVTGMIKKEFATLGTLTAPTLSNPTTFDGTVNNSGKLKNFTFTLSAYPDLAALIAAPVVEHITVNIGGKSIGYNSTKLYDPSWIFGAVRYKVRLSVDGTTVAEMSQETNTFTTQLNVAANSKVTACGYYGFDIAALHSTEICKTFNIADLNVTIPTFSDHPYSSMEDWLSANGITNQTVTLDFPNGTKLADIGNVKSVHGITEGSTITLSELSTKNISVIVFDKLVNLATEFINKPLTYASPVCSIFTCHYNPASGTKVTAVKIGSTAIDTSKNYSYSEIKAAGGVINLTVD